MGDINDMNTETELVSQFFNTQGVIKILGGLPVDGHQGEAG